MSARSKNKTSAKAAGSPKKGLAGSEGYSSLFVNMAHHIPDAMIALDNRLTIIGWNAAAERVYGWKAEEAVGKNFDKLLQTKLDENKKGNLLSMARKTGKWSGEAARVRKDGVRIWVWSSVSEVRDEAGNLIGLICISRDVTERRQMERELIRSNALITVLSRAAAQTNVLHDPDQVLETLGRALKEMGIDSIIGLLAPDAQALVIQYTSIEPRLLSIGEKVLGIKLIGYRIEYGANPSKELLKEIIERKKPLFVPNPVDLTRTLFPGIKRTVIQRALKAANINLDVPVLYLPLVSEERTVGVLGLWGPDLRESDLPALTVFASQIAATFMNARLHEEVRNELTERKQAEEKLRDSEKRYRALFDQTHDAVFILDLQGNHLDANQRAADMLGYTREEVRRLSLRDTSGELEKSLKVLERVANGEHIPSYERIFRRKDGRLFPVEINVELVRDAQGNPLYVQSTVRDITQRKQAEVKLRDSQARLSSLVDTAMDAIISLDEDQRIILFNPAAELMFGCPAAEAMGQPLDRFIPERFRESHRRHIRGFGLTNQTRRGMGKLGQLTCVRSNGEEFPAEISISQAEVGGKRIYTAILRDTTERLKVNESLRASEARFRALFEDVPVAIWEEDFSEVKKYLDSLKDQGVADLRAYFASHPEEVIRCEQMIRVIDLNNAAVEMFEAKSREELLNFTRETNSKGELENGPEDLVAIAEGRLSRSWEGGDQTLTGRPIQINLSWSVVPGHEQDYSRVIVTTMDITERKQAEEALLTSEKTFRGLFNSVAEAIYVQDAGGRFLDVNEGALKMYGYPKEFFIGNTPEPLSAPGRNDLNEVAKAVEAAFKGEPQQFEFWGIRSNGEVFPKDVRLYKGTYFGKDVVIALAQDITERKRAEEKIRALARFPSENPNPVMRFDAHAKMLYANPASAPLLSFWNCDIGGYPPLEWKERIENRQAGSFDLDCGEQIFSVMVAPVEGETYVNLYARDITERKQAEMARERLLNVLEASLNEIYIFDPDSLKFEYVNNSARLNLGYAFEDLKRMTPVDLKPEFTEASFREKIAPLLRGEQPVLNFETAHRRADGSLYPVEVHLQLVETGNERAFLAVINDTTRRKQAESQREAALEQLRVSEERFRLFADNVEEGLWITDAENEREIYLSPAIEQIWGRPLEELRRENAFLENVLPEDQPIVLYSLDMQKKGKPTDMEYRIRRLDGSARWIWDRAFPILNEDAKVRIVAGLVTDITERKQAELEIRRRTQDLTLINTLNEAANRGESVETITNLFIQEAYSMFDCKDAAIYLVTPDGEYLEMQNDTLPSEIRQRIEDFIGVSIPKIRLPIREGSYTQYALSRAEGILTDDPLEIQKWMLEFTETTFLPEVLRAPIRAIVPRIFDLLGIRSMIAIPLVSSGQIIGLMDFSSANRFTEEDLKRMLPISRQMTAILLRKRAESNVEVQLKRIIALNDIDRAIGSGFDMRLSLDVLLKEVLSQLGVDAASVLLMNPVDLSLEYAAGKGFRTTNIRQSRLKMGEGLAGKAGLEQKVLHIPNLQAAGGEFLRSSLLEGEEFVEYFGVPLLAKGALKGVLEIFNRAPLHPDPDWIHYLETLGGQAAIAVDNAQLFENMQRSNQELAMAYDATIAGWSRAMDLRDKETEGHTLRVTELTEKLARRMNIPQQELIHIRRGGLLHDIGKLGVPDNILLKPGKLTDEEWEIMRQHPRYAFEMLLPVKYLHPALDIPYAHHEKWDGTGYPRGLKGEQIPLAARLFAVVDVWDALRSDRPYREKWSAERAREYILEQSGKHFDPQVVTEFMRMLDEMPEQSL